MLEQRKASPVQKPVSPAPLAKSTVMREDDDDLVASPPAKPKTPAVSSPAPATGPLDDEEISLIDDGLDESSVLDDPEDIEGSGPPGGGGALGGVEGPRSPGLPAFPSSSAWSSAQALRFQTMMMAGFVPPTFGGGAGGLPGGEFSAPSGSLRAPAEGFSGLQLPLAAGLKKLGLAARPGFGLAAGLNPIFRPQARGMFGLPAIPSGAGGPSDIESEGLPKSKPQPGAAKGLFPSQPATRPLGALTPFAKIRSSKEVAEARQRQEEASTLVGKSKQLAVSGAKGVVSGVESYASTLVKGAKRVGQHLLGTEEERARLTEQDKIFATVTWEVLKQGPENAWALLKRVLITSLIAAVTKKAYESLPEPIQDRIKGSVLDVGGDVASERLGARAGAAAGEKVSAQIVKKLGPKFVEQFSKEYALKAQRYLIKKLAGRVGASVIASGPIGMALALVSLEGTITEAYQKSEELKTKYPDLWAEVHAQGNLDLKYYLIADDVTALEKRITAELEAIAGQVVDDTVEKLKEALRRYIPGLDFGGQLNKDGGVDGWFEAYGGLISGTLVSRRNPEESAKFDGEGQLLVKLPYTKNSTSKIMLEKNRVNELTVGVEPDTKAFPAGTRIEVILGGAAPRVKIYTTLPLMGEQMLEGTISEDGEIALSARIEKDISGNTVVKKVAGILKYGQDSGWSVEAGGVELNLGGMFTGSIGLQKNEDGELEYEGNFRPVTKKVEKGAAVPAKSFDLPKTEARIPVASLGGLANINAVAGVEGNVRLNVQKPALELETATLSGKASELLSGKLPDGDIQVKLGGGGITGTAEASASLGGEAAVEIPRVTQIAAVDLKGVGGVRGELGFGLAGKARLAKSESGENYELNAGVDGEANSRAEFFLKLLTSAKVMSTEIFSWEPFGEKVWELGKSSLHVPLARLKYKFGSGESEPDTEGMENPLEVSTLSSLAVKRGMEIIKQSGQDIVDKIYTNWEEIQDSVLPHRRVRKNLTAFGESGLDYSSEMMAQGWQEGGLSGAGKAVLGGAVGLPSAVAHGAGHILSLPNKTGSAVNQYGNSLYEQSLEEPASLTGFLKFAGGGLMSIGGKALEILS